MTAPHELVTLLFDTPSYRVEIKTASSSRWFGNQLVWNDWFDAFVYAVDLSQRWTQVQEVRVVAGR